MFAKHPIMNAVAGSPNEIELLYALGFKRTTQEVIPIKCAPQRSRTRKLGIIVFPIPILKVPRQNNVIAMLIHATTIRNIHRPLILATNDETAANIISQNRCLIRNRGLSIR